MVIVKSASHKVDQSRDKGKRESNLKRFWYLLRLDDIHYSKTCLKRPLKIDKINVLMENGSLMKVESIAECSPWNILQYF